MHPDCVRAQPRLRGSTMLRRSVILELGTTTRSVRHRGFRHVAAGLDVLRLCLPPEPLYVMNQHATNITRRRAHMAYVHWLAQDYFAGSVRKRSRRCRRVGSATHD